MAKSEKRVKITLECTECKRRNYITMKNKLNDRERLEMKKYCPTTGGTRSTRRPADHARAAGVDRRLPAVGAAGRLPGGRPATEGSSSAGRASVSKTDGRGFESLLPCSPSTER